MKYEYKIKDGSVTEFENKIYNGNWSFEFLKKDTAPSLLSFMGVADSSLNSLKRIRNWAIQNHPELFL
jgi:hypothetical protein